jgi:hypothetical protein
MSESNTEGRDRRGTTAPGRNATEKDPLDVCDSARVAETYRLEKDDEACDDGIK